MSARWDRLPPKARVKKPRQKPKSRATYRCRACDEILETGDAAAQRHADEHGGARLDLVLHSQRANRRVEDDSEGETK